MLSAKAQIYNQKTPKKVDLWGGVAYIYIYLAPEPSTLKCFFFNWMIPIFTWELVVYPN